MTIAKRIATLLLAAAAAAALYYLVRHLYRWEWHRALFSALVVIAAEIAGCTAYVVRVIRRTSDEDRASRRREPTHLDPVVLARIRNSRQPSRRHFAWLQDRSELSVFVSFLIGGGVLVSAGAWLVDRIAQGTAGAGRERDLADRLSAIAYPEDGLLPVHQELIAKDAAMSNDAHMRLLLGPTGETP